jgi:hypothetical protein
MSETTTIDLPEGYTVREDSAVGVSYCDDQGHIVLQHPRDSDSARKMVWRIWEVRRQRDNQK